MVGITRSKVIFAKTFLVSSKSSLQGPIHINFSLRGRESCLTGHCSLSNFQKRKNWAVSKNLLVGPVFKEWSGWLLIDNAPPQTWKSYISVLTHGSVWKGRSSSFPLSDCQIPLNHDFPKENNCRCFSRCCRWDEVLITTSVAHWTCAGWWWFIIRDFTKHDRLLYVASHSGDGKQNDLPTYGNS